jgi:hypothetical protein
VQLAGKFEIGRVGRRIPGEIAAVDDEIGPRRVNVVSWSRLSEQNLRVDKWSVCRG